MNKTVSSVMDDLNPYESRHGTLWYVNCMFTDDSVGSIAKKTEEAAQTVLRQLQDAIGEELDFQIEDAGTSGGGRQKWKITGFGPPGGEPTYTAPGVQGGGEGAVSKAGERRPPARSPEQIDDIRRAVALKAAAIAAQGLDAKRIIAMAREFEADYLKASEPASSAYASDIPGNTQAGAGSEDRGEGVGGGEAPASSPHQGVEVLPPANVKPEDAPPSADFPHEHDWQPTGLHGKLKCAGCNEMRDRESVT